MTKKIKGIIKSFICMALVMTMGFSTPISHLGNMFSNGVKVYADEDIEDAYDVELEPEEEIPVSTEEIFVVEEQEELREEDKKIFEMSDGTMKACLYPQAVHYLKDGVYEAIDNSLELIETDSEEFIESEINSDSVVNENEELIITEEPIATELIVSENPVVTEEVDVTETPIETDIPVITEEVEATKEVMSETEIPVEMQDPVVPEYSIEMRDTAEFMSETEESLNTEIPLDTEEPSETEMPIETEIPVKTEEAVITEEPEETPAITEEPEETKAPVVTEENISLEESTDNVSKEDSEQTLKTAKKKNKNKNKPGRKGAYYKNKANSFTVKLPEEYGTDYTEFTDENGFVSFKLLGTEKKSFKKEVKKSLEKDDETIARDVNDKGTYKSIKKHVDLEYDVSGEMLKETIVLNKKTKDDFVFEVRTSAESAALNEDGSITFYDEKEEELYVISAPYMSDAAGEYSKAIEVEFIATEEGYLMTYKPDEEWLYDKKREYPVRIDPTMFKALNVENIKDTYVASYQNANAPDIWGLTDVLTVGRRTNGYIMRSMIKFDIPSAIGANDCIIDAKLYLVHYFGVYSSEITDGIQIDVHELTGPFTESGTYWSNKPSYSSTVIDYTKVDKDRYFPDTEIPYDSYNITELANKWHNGETNNGLMLKLHDDGTAVSSDKEVYYFAKQSVYYGDVTKYVEITYRNTLGLEDYWSYSSHSVGRAGTGYINLYNGNQVFVHEDVSNNTLINGFTLSHVYNSGLAQGDYTDSDIEMYGNGWRLSLVHRLQPASITGNSSVKYVYTEGDGTKHYLIKTGGKIVDEDGLGLKYSSCDGDSKYNCKLETKDGTNLYFDTAGYMTRIEDSNGNYINLNFEVRTDGSKRLKTIKTSSNDEFELEYDSISQLNYIKDKVGRTIRYNYDNNRLVSIGYTDGTSSKYEYSGYKLNLAREPGGSAVKYSHTVRGKVDKIDYIGGGIRGLRQTFTYDYCQTKVSDQNANDQDVYSLYYQFDTAGRATCIYDSEGNICSQSFTEESTDIEKIFSNNKTDIQSRGSVYTENLLKNGSFTNGLTDWSQNSGTFSVVTLNNLLTTKTIKIVNSAESYTVIHQSVNNATSGTYTLSGYVKGVNVKGAGGVGVRIVVNTSSGGTRTVESELITNIEDEVTDNGYVKVSATVTLADGEKINRIEAGLLAASGTAYIDSLQLEKSKTGNQINLLDNSSFENTISTSSDEPYGYTSGTNTDTDNSGIVDTSYKKGSHSLKIKGDANKNQSYYKTVSVKGEEGDAFSFGGWGKANSVEAHDNKPFCIRLTFNNTDDTTTVKYAEFNTAVSGWQFTQNTVIAEKAYGSVQIAVRYDKNLNNGYFDGVFLYRDIASSYTYDENGNVISTKDYAAQQSEFQYSGNNMSKLVDPTGLSYEYYYNSDTNNLESAKTSEGTQYIFKNDGVGNPTRVRVAASDNSASIQNGKTYYIRLKGSGKYLTNDGTNVSQAEYVGGNTQKWKAEQTKDGYYVFHPMNATGKSLDIKSGSDDEGTSVIVYTTGYGNNQKFKVEPQSNYTYKLVPKCSDTGKKITVKGYNGTAGTNSVILSAGDGAESYSWYFEDADASVSSVTSGTVYRVRAYHSGRYMNVYGAGTVAGTKVCQYQLTYDNNQHFLFTEYNNSGYYTIRPMHTSTILAMSEENSEKYTSYKYLCLSGVTHSNATDKNLFKLEYDSEKRAFQIIPKSGEGKVVSVVSSSKSNDAELLFFASGTETNNYFVLEECSKEIVTKSTYEAKGRYPETTTDASGNVTSYSYDAKTDLLSSTTDAKGTVTEYNYDENNDLLKSVKVKSVEVKYGYNTNGSLDTITAPNRTTYKFTYDSFGRSLKTLVGTRTLGTYAYKNNYSNLVSRFTYGNGSYIDYTYDSSNRLTKRVATDDESGSTSTKTYTYDNLSNIAKVYDGKKGVTTTYNYDLSQRLTGLSQSNGYKLKYGYDEYNRIIKQKYSTPDNNLTTEYIYGNNTIVGQKTGYLNSIEHGTNQSLTYIYDDLGRILIKSIGINGGTSQISYKYADGTSKNTTTNLISQMNLGYLTSTAPLEFHSDIYGYKYDSNGNITEISLNGQAIAKYSYDGTNQLRTEQRGADTYSYTYDINGNIVYITKNGVLWKTYNYNDSEWSDLLTSYNGYDIEYDEIGNPLKYRDDYSFTWEFGRNLGSVKKGNKTVATYLYDADNYRRRKTVDGKVTNYSYVDGVLLSEYNSTEEMLYLHDESGSIVGIKIETGSSSKSYYFQKNIQGDVIGIIDDSGLQVAAYTYDAWGNILSITGSDAKGIGEKNPIRYRGYYYDKETGFYLTGTRYYDPEIGRFINADSVISGTGESVQGYNLFAYCFNNPVNMEDPSGNFPKFLKNSVKWIAEKIVKPIVKAVQKVLSKVNRTYSKGINVGFTLTGIYSASAQGGVSIDTKGNVAIQGSAAAGITTGEPGISVTQYESVTNAPSIDQLNGPGYNVGFSGTFIPEVPIIIAGGDINILEDQDNNKTYFGKTTNIGFGTPGMGAHVETSITGTWEATRFNIFTVAEDVYISIMEW